MVSALVRDIPDWPRPGVVFRDITPLLHDPEAFGAVVDALVEVATVPGRPVTRVLGVEARGFVFGAPVAYKLGAGFVPVRKAGKLPWEIEREEYVLEYGVDLLEIHRDAVHPGEQVVIVDDVLATGGTAAATIRLVEKLGGVVAGLAFVMEIEGLGGRQALAGHDIDVLATFPSGAAGAEA
ncbi:adenine phosphoribosyltransferase [Rhabdothermincola salaria]|uniref:adenine phosphoribosyltransferase n=1 Tax=Rhabdothermincola salaria TaxID=2903142 RepID=UPI001E38D234|nr:adenine phosphoribosyltransferase [Rhabdothermincola salaria]MCD9622635.1 adenine phosphoribosyltransferase [Rhabdothermincola salaria]